VLAKRDFVLPNTCFLVDWLVPADDHDATWRWSPTAEQRTNALGARRWRRCSSTAIRASSPSSGSASSSTARSTSRS
jgi:hypothetical protein